MSSILTNNSAMVALQTLRNINSNLSTVQSEISTGKTVGSAKDNAAVWAISKTMESDVKGFKGISDSLSLGESTVAVARQAAETVTDLLTDIKGKVVAAQEDNVDRAKIQTDIEALTKQIESVVEAAQFNGLNLVDGSQTGVNSNSGVSSDSVGIDILSSLNRKTDGTVVASKIGVDAQNLSFNAGEPLDTTVGMISDSDTGTVDTFDAGGTLTFETFLFQDGGSPQTGTVALAGDDASADKSDTTSLLAGDKFSLTVGSVQAEYVVQEGDTQHSLVAGMKNALQASGFDETSYSVAIVEATGSMSLALTNNTNEDVAFSFSASRGSGGLAGLDALDVSSSASAEAALGSIETMIQTAIDASAEFGSVQGRISIQSEFVSNLSDALKSGIGAMVDADMEAASARLQALQVQQQLGTQSLSIANQGPQNLLSLFR